MTFTSVAYIPVSVQVLVTKPYQISRFCANQFTSSFNLCFKEKESCPNLATEFKVEIGRTCHEKSTVYLLKWKQKCWQNFKQEGTLNLFFLYLIVVYFSMVQSTSSDSLNYSGLSNLFASAHIDSDKLTSTKVTARRSLVVTAPPLKGESTVL